MCSAFNSNMLKYCTLPPPCILFLLYCCKGGSTQLQKKIYRPLSRIYCFIQFYYVSLEVKAKR